MKDPLSTLALIYNNFNDTLRLNATLNKVDRIIDLQNEDLSDSIQYDLITFESFDDNIQEESENLRNMELINEIWLLYDALTSSRIQYHRDSRG